MEFPMTEANFRYAIQSAMSYQAVNGFLDELDGEEDTALRKKLYDMRDKYLGHVFAHVPDGRASQAVKDRVGGNFLRYTIFALAGPLSFNERKLPPGLLDCIEEMQVLDDCNVAHEFMEMRYDVFFEAGPVSASWIWALTRETYRSGICVHGLSSIYTLAEAFVCAMERENAREAHRQAAQTWAGTFSPSVAAAFEDALRGDGEEDEVSFDS